MKKLLFNYHQLCLLDDSKSVLNGIKISLFFVLMFLLIPMQGRAEFQYESVTYDFGTCAKSDGSITMSSRSYSSLTAASYANTMTYDGNEYDISRFAFRSGSSGWFIRNKTPNYPEQYGLFTNQGVQLAICDLHAGDKVTINYSVSNVSNNLTYASGAQGFRSVSGSNQYMGVGENYQIASGNEVTMTQDGDLIIKANDNYTYIYTITIKSLTSEATYSLNTTENGSSRSTTFTFTGEGRMTENMVSIPFMEVTFGSDLNGVLVHDSGNAEAGLCSYIPDWSGYWHIWVEDGKPYQGTYYVFKPTAKGKLQIKGLNSGGNTYIYEVNGTTFTEKASVSGDGYKTIPTGWLTLEKGKTYYVCDNPTSRSYNNFQLHEFTYTNEFDMPLAKVLTNGAINGELATVKGATTLEKFTVKRASGNINTANINVTFSATDNDKGTLNISGIAYNDDAADKAGTIVLDLEFDGGNATFVATIPYSAEKGHTWNFYDTRKSDSKGNNSDGILEIGQYSSTSSTLYQQTQEGEWKATQRVKGSTGGIHDPYYANMNLMSGNNANMIWETEGLWFETPAQKSCIYNENNVNDTEYTDRYVGLLPGGAFTIPGLKKDDRVIIFMGSGDGSGTNACFMHITNALDAVGTPITTSENDGDTWYNAGGSEWNGDHSDYNLRGCYHFSAAANGDIVFKMVGGSMTKIYSIQIYSGERISTNDPTRVASYSYNGTNYNKNGYQYLNSYRSEDAGGAYILHYRGKGEPTGDPKILLTTGNLTPSLGTDLLRNGDYILYKSTKGQYGTFRIRIPCMEYHGRYVTDFGEQNICVGYYEKKEYPYTWDFTDFYTEYANTAKGLQKESEYIEYKANTWYEDSENDCFRMNLRNSNYNGELVCVSGSQLYAGTTMFAETAGLQISMSNPDNAYNGSLSITNDGIRLANPSEPEGDAATEPMPLRRGWWTYSVTVPEVPAGAAVYVRASRAEEVKEEAVTFWPYSQTYGTRQQVTETFFKKTYNLGTGAETVFGSNDNSAYIEASDGSGDYILAVKNSSSAAQDIKLNLNGFVVKRIAVSEDAKKVNIKGYASESRARVIDNSLTSYFTGKSNVGAYILKKEDIDYTNMTVTLTAVGDQLIPVGTTGAKNGLVIYNADNADDSGEIKILDGGFHLFVPDMHDTEKAILDWGTNELIAQLTQTTLPFSGKDAELQNYVLSYSYYHMDENGNKTGETVVGEEGFYRVGGNGIGLRANSAYVQFEKSKLMTSTSSSASAKIMFHTEDDETEVTGIESIAETMQNDRNDVYYTINGIRISKPTKSGIYIKNGKKIVIK